jgi:cytochrome c556
VCIGRADGGDGTTDAYADGMRFLGLLLAIVLAACIEEAPAAQPSLPLRAIPAHRERLPALARSTLKKEMSRHGKDAEALLAAVLDLDHERAAAIADRIATEPRIARVSGADTANALFPPEFFDYQDELRAASQQLAVTARSGDDVELANAFSRLTKTCVSCHSTFLRMSP